jgi:hypothetical protein
MAIRITVTVDEDRLRQAGLSADPDDITAELGQLQGGRLSLQTGDHWIPVKSLMVRSTR